VVVPTSDASSSRALPVLWRGLLLEPSGYADEARTILVALERAGYELAARELPGSDIDAGLSPSVLGTVGRALSRPAPQGNFLLVDHYIPNSTLKPHPDGPTVVRTMFETDRIPSNWRLPLLALDEIWVPTAFNVESFERGGVPAKRLRILPMTVDFELFDPSVAVDPLPVSDKRGFTFLANFDFADRKGWDVLLDAWADAFGPDDDVCLLLKCVSMHKVTGAEMGARIEAYLRGRRTAPIVLNTDVLPVAELPRLYAAADAYVLPSRGEGWGRPYMEAMAMGLPTIGSRWSGNLGFMNDANSWLVDGSVVDVREGTDHQIVFGGHRWFEPDREALTALLREVATGAAAVREKAAGARSDLLERFAPELIAARIVELTEDVLDRWRRRGPVGCVWRGDFGSVHSLAVVNDGTVDALEVAGTAVELVATEAPASSSDAVGVASHWPPRFEAPSAGPFVLYQAWEFGRIPQSWLEEIRLKVDEVWVHSEPTRQAYLHSGVPEELVHVVPGGVDLERFQRTGPTWPIETDKSTVFMFVGGVIYRKGVDVLLNAYGRAFTADDDVCLVLKGFGARGVYRGSTGDKMIEDFQSRPGYPELVFLNDDVPYESVPALYRAADVLVQPYRGEGFCLPALEALACGRPVIVTDGGSTDDFVGRECGWRIPSRHVPLYDGALPAAYDPGPDAFLLEPDVDALVAALREAADPAARAARAEHARPHAERLSWARVGEAASLRLEALRRKTPIRRIGPAVVADRRRLLLAVLADWSDRETWAPAVRAYVEAFDPGADTTLILAAADEEAAVAAVAEELAKAGRDLASIPDIALADARDVEPVALELAADAVVLAGGRPPTRARLVVPANADALRSLGSSTIDRAAA